MGHILKWQFNRPGTWVYPSIRVTASDGDVIESDYAIDAFWSEVDPATPATIDPPSPILPPFSETPDGAILVYSQEANQFVPSVVAPFDELGRVNDPALPDRLSVANLDTAYVRQDEIDEKIDARFTGRTITVSDAPHGAKGDGVTDDTAAWASVAATVNTSSALISHTVMVPPGVYPVNSFPNLPSNVTLLCQGGTAVIKLMASVTRMVDLNNRTNVRFEGLTFDFNGNVTSSGVRMGTGASRIKFRRCTFTSSAPVSDFIYLVDVTEGCANSRFIDCLFLNMLNPLRISGAVINQDVKDCTFSGFGNRGVFVNGTAEVASPFKAAACSRDTTIRGCTFINVGNFRTVTNKVLSGFVATLTVSGDDNPYIPGMVTNVQGVGAPFDGTARTVTAVSGMNVSFAINEADVASTAVTKTTNYPPAIVQAGDPRTPIAIRTSGNWHEGLKIIDNTIVGNDGIAHHLTLTGDPESGALLGGCSDAIGVQGASGFIVSRNTVRYSGEVGITISNTSRYGKVSGNMVSWSNTNGVALQDISDVDCDGNSFRNNGREQAAPSGDRVGAHNAIWVKNVVGSLIANNRCVDDQVTPTQKQVVYFTGTNSDIDLGHNPRRLGTTALIEPATVSRAGVKFNIPPLRTKATADETRADATLVAHTHGLSFTGLEAGAVYRLDARLIYAAIQAADISIKWSGPTGATLQWFADAALNNTTSATGASAGSRQALNIASTLTFGGAGSSTIGNDIYADIRDAELTIGSTAGDLVLTWAQGQSPSVPDAVNLSTIRAGSWLRLTRIG